MATPTTQPSDPTPTATATCARSEPGPACEADELGAVHGRHGVNDEEAVDIARQALAELGGRYEQTQLQGNSLGSHAPQLEHIFLMPQ